MTEIQAIKCKNCGKLHEKGKNSYVKVQGSIFIGEGGELLGGDKDCTSRFCHECFLKIAKEIPMKAHKNKTVFREG